VARAVWSSAESFRVKRGSHALRAILLGPPGAGKGTQAKLIQEHEDVMHVSTGDLLRAAVARGTDLGKAAKRYMDEGRLVPDRLVIDMIEDRIIHSNGHEGFLLDGFPRTKTQAEALNEMLAKRAMSLDHVFNLVVAKPELIRRLSGRRTCRQCGTMYHVEFNPPKTPGTCTRCGGELFQREDDRPETIASRLDVYDRETLPLCDYYRSRGLLRDIDAVGDAETVLSRILSFLDARS
jgi:adenylate kinase